MVEATDAAGAVTWQEIVRLGPAELRDRVVGHGAEDTWTQDPAALLAIAAAHREPGSANPYAVEPYLDAADRALDGVEGVDALRVLAPVIRSTSLRALGRFTAAREQLTLADRRLADGALPLSCRVELESLVSLETGLCQLLTGRLDEAHRALRRALNVAEDRTPPAVRAEALAAVALIELRSGGLRSADAHLAAARIAATQAGPAPRLGSALIELADAAVAIERGAIDGIGDRLVELIAETASTEYAPLVVAESAEASEDDDQAADLLQDVQFLVREWEAPNLPLALHDEHRIAMLVRRREVVAARAEIGRLEPDSAHSQCPPTWSARVALDTGDPARAIELAADCLELGDAHAPRTAVMSMLVTAAAHAALGDIRTADDLFDRSVALAAPSAAVRPFGILAPHELAGLIDRSAHARNDDGGATSSRALLDAVAARYPTRDAYSPESLSARERVVLSRLSGGATHHGIAFDLSVSPNTIKTQVRSIYRKLGVTTRDGAVQRARHLGLID
ncbi:helix-turn-helix transcriptional regulator [Agromyces flavus]|nr:LuxR C-terminal-related transcriptional regulator [Agromyces flavus]GGI44410.1 hypothetical protein GCM10010932_04470 [Agromyces flavus]SDT03002.1 regulatory protein, luxR family [Agromyces flavus]